MGQFSKSVIQFTLTPFGSGTWDCHLQSDMVLSKKKKKFFLNYIELALKRKSSIFRPLEAVFSYLILMRVQ